MYSIYGQAAVISLLQRSPSDWISTVVHHEQSPWLWCGCVITLNEMNG